MLGQDRLQAAYAPVLWIGLVARASDDPQEASFRQPSLTEVLGVGLDLATQVAKLFPQLRDLALDLRAM